METETQSTVKTNKLITLKGKPNKGKPNILIDFTETLFGSSGSSGLSGSPIVEVEPTLNVEESKLKLYSQLRDPYKSSEYIPNNMISSIISHHFKSAELLHSFSENHLLFRIQISDILNGQIENWEYNRPPDMSRCPDIARYMYNSKKPIDTMIYLTYKNIPDHFEVLDGIHRITALRHLKEENSKTLELISFGDFGSNNDAEWIYKQYLIVNIRFNAFLGDLIEIFKTLNKSQTVPDIYIRDITKEKRDIIEAIANEWQIKYKKHYSSSANPIIGNTNRNKFVDLLDKIYDKYKISETKVHLFRQVLEEANTKLSHNIPAKASIDTRVKCKETGCYLFLYKNDKLEEFI